MNKYKKLTLDTILFGISTFASKLLIFFLLPLYTAVLSTEEYGIADLLTNVVNLIYPIFTLAIAEACLRFAFSKEINKNEILSSCMLLVVISFVFLLCLYPISSIFGTTLNNFWIIFSFLYLGYSLQNCFSFYCRGIEKKKVFAIQGIIQTVVMIALNLLFLLVFKLGLLGFLLSYIISYFAAVTYMIMYAGIIKDLVKFKINKKLLCDMLKYSIPIVPTMVSWWINNSADKYFIIGFVGIGASGIYSVAHKIPSLITTVSSIFNNAWSISAISEYDSENNSRFYTNIFNFYFIIIILFGGFVAIVAPIICKFLFASNYYSGWVYVPPLVCAAVFQAMAGFIASIFRAIKKTNVLFISTTIGAVINIILNYFFIKFFGVIGVAYTTMISFLIVFIIRMKYCNKYIKINTNYIKMYISILLLIMLSMIMCNEFPYKKYICNLIYIFMIIINLNYISRYSKTLLLKLKKVNKK